MNIILINTVQHFQCALLLATESLFWKIFTLSLEVVSAVAALLFGMYAIFNDTNLKDGQMTSKRRVALYGVIISGVLAVGIKATQGVIGITTFKREKQISDSLDRKKQQGELKDSRYKAKLSASLLLSLNNLQSLQSKSDNAGKSLQGIDSAQKKNTILQVQAARNTKRALTAILPVRIGLVSVLSLDRLPKELVGFKSYYMQMVKVKDSLEKGLLIETSVGLVQKQINGTISTIEINSQNPYFSKYSIPIASLITRSFMIDFLEKVQTGTGLKSEEPGFHLYVSPGKSVKDYGENFNRLSLTVRFGDKTILVEIYSEKAKISGRRDLLEHYYSVYDIIGKYLYIQNDLTRYGQGRFLSLHTANGLISCIPLTKEGNTGSEFSKIIKREDILNGGCDLRTF
jgi:hypothetical protein